MPFREFALERGEVLRQKNYTSTPAVDSAVGTSCSKQAIEPLVYFCLSDLVAQVGLELCGSIELRRGGLKIAFPRKGASGLLSYGA